eukprot:355193-Chlamydomonas_euryale.AAC.3
MCWRSLTALIVALVQRIQEWLADRPHCFLLGALQATTTALFEACIVPRCPFPPSSFSGPCKARGCAGVVPSA